MDHGLTLPLSLILHMSYKWLCGAWLWYIAANYTLHCTCSMPTIHDAFRWWKYTVFLSPYSQISEMMIDFQGSFFITDIIDICWFSLTWLSVKIYDGRCGLSVGSYISPSTIEKSDHLQTVGHRDSEERIHMWYIAIDWRWLVLGPFTLAFTDQTREHASREHASAISRPVTLTVFYRSSYDTATNLLALLQTVSRPLFPPSILQWRQK